MNDMRKLMETLQQINEAGYGDEWCDGCGQGRDQCVCNEETIEEDEQMDEGIFTDNKAMIIKYTGRKAEDAIQLAQLGIELDGEHAELFKEIRQELIELKQWLRKRK